MLFKEIISLQWESYKTQIQNVALLIVEAGGTYNYHWALKG
jgi:hypothetical protein